MKIIHRETIDILKKGGFSLVVALLGGMFLHGCYENFFEFTPFVPHICLEELEASDMFWFSAFFIWAGFWVGWLCKEYWVSKREDEDRV